MSERNIIDRLPLARRFTVQMGNRTSDPLLYGTLSIQLRHIGQGLRCLLIRVPHRNVQEYHFPCDIQNNGHGSVYP